LVSRSNVNQGEADVFSGQAALAMLAIPEEGDLDIDLDRCVEI